MNSFNIVITFFQMFDSISKSLRFSKRLFQVFTIIFADTESRLHVHQFDRVIKYTRISENPDSKQDIKI